MGTDRAGISMSVAGVEAMAVRAYVRVSTEEQAEEGFSLAAQRARIRDFCRSQWGTDPPILWYEDEGWSAKDTQRPRLRALRQELQPGDTVVVLRLDRLTRSVLDLYTLLKEWETGGAFFRSVTEPYDTERAEGRFMIGLLALLAEWERLRIGERTREVMANSVRADGRHLSRAPFGYRMADGQLEVVPHEAAVVREIFAGYRSGQGCRAIAEGLNRQGTRTRRGALWSDASVAYLLRNPVYAGRVAWQRSVRKGRRQAGGAIVAPGAHQPLVAPPEWEAVQELLNARPRVTPRTAGSPFLLSGLARCGLCGGPVHGVTQRRYQNGLPIPEQERRYYRCARRNRRRGCGLPYHPADELERRLVECLGPVGPPERLLAVAAASPVRAGSGVEQKAHRETALRRNERARLRWDQAYEAEAINQAEWLERRRSLAAERQGLMQAPALPAGPEIADPRALAAAMADLPRIWSFLALPDRRLLLDTFLLEVALYPGRPPALHRRR